ncbi:MAG: hypothetical protein ABEL97_07120 [Salinibacter sp.]
MVKQRTLGDSTLTVPAVGLGCMGMSDFYGTPDENRTIKTLRRAQTAALPLAGGGGQLRHQVELVAFG